MPVEAGILATAIQVGEGLLFLGAAGVLPPVFVSEEEGWAWTKLQPLGPARLLAPAPLTRKKLLLLGPAGALAPAPLMRKKLLPLWKQRLTPALVQGVSVQAA